MIILVYFNKNCGILFTIMLSFSGSFGVNMGRLLSLFEIQDWRPYVYFLDYG